MKLSPPSTQLAGLLLALLIAAPACKPRRPAPRSPQERGRAMERCLAALKKLRADPPTVSSRSLDRIHARTTRGCAGLYADPACREAIAGAGAGQLSYVRVCRERYCPRLGPNTPAACSGPLETDAQRRAAWSALKGPILRVDLGEALLARFVKASREVLQVAPRLERLEPPRARARRQVQVLIRGKRATGDCLVLLEERPHRLIHACKGQVDQAALSATICQLRGEHKDHELHASVAAEDGVAYGLIVAAMDSVLSGGISQIQVSDAGGAEVKADRRIPAARRACGEKPRACGARERGAARGKAVPAAPAVPAVPAIELPSGEPTSGTPQVVIDERGVLLNGTVVAKPGELKNTGVDWKLPELHRRLQKLRAAAQGGVTGEVIVRAGPKVEFGALKLVMYTCGLAGYANLQFAALNEDKAPGPAR